jgi:phosphoglycolate phosphatase
MTATSHLIFDLDGTLVDSAPMLVEVANDMLRDRDSSRTLTVADARPFLNHGGLALVAGLLAHECGELDDEVAEFRRRYARRRTDSAHLFPGVKEGLRALYALGFSMAVCSNKPQELCEKVLVDVGLAHMFEAVVGSTPAHRLKPHPDLLVLALRRLGAEASRAILIGDSEVDHALAHNAAVPFFFVTYGYADEQWDCSGLVRFHRFVDLVNSLRGAAPADHSVQYRAA